MAVTSGAADSMASSTANLSVTDDDGQPWQVPSSLSRTTPAGLMSSEFHIAAMRAEVGPDTVQRRGHPRLHVLGVQPVDHQQAGDQLVGGQRVQRSAVELSAVIEDFQDPGQPGAVQFRHLADQFLGAPAGHRPAGSEGVEETFDPVAGRPRPVLARHGSYSAVRVWVGECSFSKVWPLPRYMWTPQGRQGSKLRTVRMMSMPLKCSRSFSSKIGCPWTASS